MKSWQKQLQYVNPCVAGSCEKNLNFGEIRELKLACWIFCPNAPDGEFLRFLTYICSQSMKMCEFSLFWAQILLSFAANTSITTILYYTRKSLWIKTPFVISNVTEQLGTSNKRNPTNQIGYKRWPAMLHSTGLHQSRSIKVTNIRQSSTHLPITPDTSATL